MKLIGIALIAVTLLAPSTTSAQAPVIATGGSLGAERVGDNVPPSMARIIGTDGLDLRTTVRLYATDLFWPLSGLYAAAPGETIQLRAFLNDPDSGLTDSVLTLDGETYTDFGSSPGGVVTMRFYGAFIAPPFRGNRQVVVRAPFTMNGNVGSILDPREFRGSGIATTVLEPMGGEPRLWRALSVRYDFHDPATPIRWTPVQLLMNSLDYVGLEWAEVRALGACGLLDPDVDEAALQQLLVDTDFRQLLRDYHITVAEFAGTVRWAWGYRTDLATLCQ